MSDRLALAIAELVEALREEVPIEAAPNATATDRLYSIPEAAQLLGGIGRTLVYDLIGRGELQTILAGRRRLVAGAAIANYIQKAGPDRDSGPAQPREGTSDARRSTA